MLLRRTRTGREHQRNKDTPRWGDIIRGGYVAQNLASTVRRVLACHTRGERTLWGDRVVFLNSVPHANNCRPRCPDGLDDEHWGKPAASCLEVRSLALIKAGGHQKDMPIISVEPVSYTHLTLPTTPYV